MTATEWVWLLLLVGSISIVAAGIFVELDNNNVFKTSDPSGRRFNPTDPRAIDAGAH